MKRRSFLEFISSVIGVATIGITTALGEEQVATPYKLQTSSEVYLLTINNFGANLTVNSTKNSSVSGVSGITWHSPRKWFPRLANAGDAFYFMPTHHQGRILSDTELHRLVGVYVFTGDQWFLFATNTAT